MILGSTRACKHEMKVLLCSFFSESLFVFEDSLKYRLFSVHWPKGMYSQHNKGLLQWLLCIFTILQTFKSAFLLGKNPRRLE